MAGKGGGGCFLSKKGNTNRFPREKDFLSPRAMKETRGKRREKTPPHQKKNSTPGLFFFWGTLLLQKEKREFRRNANLEGGGFDRGGGNPGPIEILPSQEEIFLPSRGRHFIIQKGVPLFLGRWKREKKLNRGEVTQYISFFPREENDSLSFSENVGEKFFLPSSRWG